MADRYLVALPSIHDILAAEQRLAGTGIVFDIVPTPTSLSTDCGMVIEIAGEHLPALRRVLEESGVAWIREHEAS